MAVLQESLKHPDDVLMPTKLHTSLELQNESPQKGLGVKEQCTTLWVPTGTGSDKMKHTERIPSTNANDTHLETKISKLHGSLNCWFKELNN